ncbi:uncharacterized protein LOC144629870 [Oculina patagonica]
MKILVVLSFVVLVTLCTGVTGDPSQCVFPFDYDGKTYNKCTYAGGESRPWCAYDREYSRGRWDYCVCSEGEARRLNCEAQRAICLPAADNEPARCLTRPRPMVGRR